MTKETHTAGGILISTMSINPIILKIIDIKELNPMYSLILFLIFFISASIGSYFPDIDMKSSYISKRYPLIWKYYGKKHVHRGFTHSAAMIVILYIFGLTLFQISEENIVIQLVSIGFTLGWISHIALDLLNSQGVMLLYPFKFKIKLLNIHSGSSWEKFMLIAIKTLTMATSLYLIYSITIRYV